MVRRLEIRFIMEEGAFEVAGDAIGDAAEGGEVAVGIGEVGVLGASGSSRRASRKVTPRGIPAKLRMGTRLSSKRFLKGPCPWNGGAREVPSLKSR